MPTFDFNQAQSTLLDLKIFTVKRLVQLDLTKVDTQN